MSSMPECAACGAYVHHGPCLCADCMTRKRAQQVKRTDILHMYIEDETKEFDRLLLAGMPADLGARDAARDNVQSRWKSIYEHPKHLTEEDKTMKTRTEYKPEQKYRGFQVRQDDWDVFGEFRNSTLHPEWYKTKEEAQVRCNMLARRPHPRPTRAQTKAQKGRGL